MSTTQQESARVLTLIANFARRIARDPHDAEDLAQMTLIKAWLSWDSDATAEWDDAQFSAWLYRITQNAWIDTNRKRARRPQTDELTDCHYASTAIESDVERRERIDIAFSQLPENQRVLLLLAAQDYSYKEIAVKMDATPRKVANRLMRARRAIREEWDAA